MKGTPFCWDFLISLGTNGVLTYSQGVNFGSFSIFYILFLYPGLSFGVLSSRRVPFHFIQLFFSESFRLSHFLVIASLQVWRWLIPVRSASSSACFLIISQPGFLLFFFFFNSFFIAFLFLLVNLKSRVDSLLPHFRFIFFYFLLFLCHLQSSAAGVAMRCWLPALTVTVIL